LTTSLPLSDVKFLLSEVDPARLPPCAAEVAFVGRSNVGKSSLINALCKQDLARVSVTPGRTRTINVFFVAENAWLVDLPGYGYASGPEESRAHWAGMIEGYLRRRPGLRRALVLVDAKVGPTKLDVEMASWLRAARLPWSVVATKADQVKPAQAAARRAEIARVLHLPAEFLRWVSAAENLGIKELRGEIAGLLAA
jgi:GTP-binding protein